MYGGNNQRYECSKECRSLVKPITESSKDAKVTKLQNVHLAARSGDVR